VGVGLKDRYHLILAHALLFFAGATLWHRPAQDFLFLMGGGRVSSQSLQLRRVELSLRICCFAIPFDLHKYDSIFVFSDDCGLCWANRGTGCQLAFAALGTSSRRAWIRGRVRFGRRSPDVSCQFVAATETCAGAFLVEFVCRTRHLLRLTLLPLFG
jgi:hypothetical protein